MTNFWGEKGKLKQKKLYIKEKFQLVFSSKIKVPQLGSARNLYSSGALEPEKSSSNLLRDVGSSPPNFGPTFTALPSLQLVAPYFQTLQHPCLLWHALDFAF